jgi:phosphate-selective porin OprO/OprP
MMLPLSYADGDKWNQWQSKYVNGIFLAAVVLDRQRWLTQDDGSRQQVGDLNEFDGGEIRGLRFGAVGTLNFDTPWVYTIFAATNAFDKGFDTELEDDLAIFDYRLDIPLSKGINLSVGKQKEPISLERLTSMINLPMQERSAVSDAMLPARNVGVVISGNGLSQRMTWAGGLFNDWFDAGQSFSESSSQAIGRVTWLPFVSEDESNLVHLGLGARYTNANEGLRFLTEPEFDNSPIFVDTGDKFPANSAMQYNLEASWRKGQYWLHSEYVRTNVDSPGVGDPTFDGYHITGSWIISGEMRTYNRKNGLMRLVPVAKSVYQGGWGAWELSVRYSTIDLTDGLIEGGEMDILSLGVNWWLSPFFNVSMNYRYITLDRMGIIGRSDGINARIVLVLE